MADFNYFKAPEAFNPNFEPLVRAELAQKEQRQAAWNALAQIAQDNRHMQAQKESQAAEQSRLSDQFNQTQDQAARFHNDELKQHQADKASALEQHTRDQENEADRQSAGFEHQDTQAAIREASDWLKTRYTQQAETERAQMSANLREQARQEAQAQIEHKLQMDHSIVVGHMNSMQDIASAKRDPNLFEDHEFTAYDLAPQYSSDPAKFAQNLRNTGFLQGQDPSDVMDQLRKVKVSVPIAKDPQWFTNILKRHHGQTNQDGTPSENLNEAAISNLTGFAHGKDGIPFANNLAEAQGRAADFFKQHDTVGSLFKGGRMAAQLPASTKMTDQEKIAARLLMREHSDNAKQLAVAQQMLGASNLSEDQRKMYQSQVDDLKARNTKIEKKIIGDDEESGETKPDNESSEGGGTSDDDLIKQAEELLKK